MALLYPIQVDRENGVFGVIPVSEPMQMFSSPLTPVLASLPIATLLFRLLFWERQSVLWSSRKNH